MTPTPTPTQQENVVKPAFVPIKDKIKVQNNRIEAERHEFELKFKEVTCKPEKSPLLEMCSELKTPIKEEDEGIQDEKIDDEKNNSSESNGTHSSSNNDSLEEEMNSPPSSETECNGNLKHQITPPKPLPRTSRTNSLAESNSMEEVVVSPTQRPLPKPRTTAYKVPYR